MQTICASEFKAKCLRLMDEVANNQEELVIKKNGKSISKLVPYHKRLDMLFGTHQNVLQSQNGSIETTGVQ